LKSIIVLALIVALRVAAAPLPTKQSKISKRTFADVIKLTMMKGGDSPCEDNIVKELGLDKNFAAGEEIPTKAISYKASVTADKKKHVFSVVYKTHPDIAQPVPVAILWDIYTAEKDSEGIHIDGYTIRLSTNGKLENAVLIHGIVDKNATHTLIDRSDKPLQGVVKNEMKFYTQDSIRLEMSKE
jgi:hypothetical protein